MAPMTAEEGDKRREAFALLRIWILSTNSPEASISQVGSLLPTTLHNDIYHTKTFKMHFTISTVLAIFMATMATTAALPTSHLEGIKSSSSPPDSY
jgi:hypothetical protein